MQKKLLFAVLLFLIAQSVLAQDKLSSTESSPTSQTLNDQNSLRGEETIVETTKVVSETYEADVYFGTTDIIIQNGDHQRMEFYGTLISDNSSCSYSICYYGWIFNGTFSNGDVYFGYTNDSLEIKPVFEFKTNSEEDFVIVRDKNLDEIWVQMIEILCQKVNPQINQINIQNDIAIAGATDEKFESVKPQSSEDFSDWIPTSDEVMKPQSSSMPKYSFQTIQYQDLIGLKGLKGVISNSEIQSLSNLQVGDKISRTSQKIPLKEFQAPTSSLKETFVLTKNNLIKSRALEYQVKLSSTGNFSDNGQKIPDFQASVQVNFQHAYKTLVLSSEKQYVMKLLDTSNRGSYHLKDINQRRQKMGEIMDPKFNVVVDEGPSFYDAQVYDFSNQKYSGVNVAEQFNSLNDQANNQLTTQSTIRKLQTVQNYTVYNFRKTLFSQNVFGRNFMAAFDIKCYMLVYSNDQKLQCSGFFVYQLFGNQRIIPVFSFIRSVSYSWSWSNQYTGNWGFNVYVSLPQPLQWIGFTFRFNVTYAINVNINFNSGGTNPFQVNVNCLTTTRVDTDSSAGVRVGVIEGGAFLTGTLVNTGTDPRIVLTYYFTQRYINVIARWDYWINAFRYNWGFYYRQRSFWSGWSSRRILSQWPTNGVYGRWVIVNRNWNIYI